MRIVTRKAGNRLELRGPNEEPLSEVAEARLQVILAVEREQRAQMLRQQKAFDEIILGLRNLAHASGQRSYLETHD